MLLQKTLGRMMGMQTKVVEEQINIESKARKISLTNTTRYERDTGLKLIAKVWELLIAIGTVEKFKNESAMYLTDLQNTVIPK